MYEKINMFSDKIVLDGVKLFVDPINKVHSTSKVMGIFYEEQPFEWFLFKKIIREINKTSNAKYDLLDVGCGSGIWSILYAKHFGGKVLSIDINKRAVDYAKMNADLNKVKITIRNERYIINTVPLKSTKLIVLNPPYHIYPPVLKNQIPLFARGGSNGQRQFYEQLKLARNHLSKFGIILFNMMCLGDNSGPNYLKQIKKIFDNKMDIFYTNIFPPITTKYFLEKVYHTKYRDFVRDVSIRFPKLYYTTGIVKNNGSGRVNCFEHKRDLKGRSWTDRIKLHQMINNVIN